MKKILLFISIFITSSTVAGAQGALKGFRVGINANTVFGPNLIYIPIDRLNGAYAGPDSSKMSLHFKTESTMGFGATTGYDFHQNFGLLLSYQYLGRRPITGTDNYPLTIFGKLVTTSWSLSGEGRLPLGSSLDLTARLGFSIISNRLSIYQGGLYHGRPILSDTDIHTIKENHWGLNYGFGFLYHFNESMDIEGGVESISQFRQRNIQNTMNIRFYVGMSYKF